MMRPDGPVARSLGQGDLVRITGAADVEVLRVRQRPERTVLHVGLRDGQGRDIGQGAIWCFAGDKARRVARRHPASLLDPLTGAVFDRFPADHRLPEIAAYLDWVTQHAPRDQRAAAPPEVLRYRPGISCTFGILQQDGRQVFTKLVTLEDLSALTGRLGQGAEMGGAVRVIHPVRIHPELRAVTYEEAEGRAFDAVLREARPRQVRDTCLRVVRALASVSRGQARLVKSLTIEELRRRAEKCHALVLGSDTGAGAMAGRLLTRIATVTPEARAVPIHGDMKADHVFLTEDRVTFIDTESMALGDPGYDLACLEASLVIGVIEGSVPDGALAACREILRRAGGDGHEWFVDVARLKAACHFAQRPGRDSAAVARAMEI